MSFNPFKSTASPSGSPSSPSLAESMGTSSSSSSPLKFPDLTSATDGVSTPSPIVIGIVTILLAFLGFNIFEYFAKGLDAVSDILKPLFQFFINLSAQIFNVSAEGAKQATVTATTSAQKAATAIAQPQNLDLDVSLNEPTKAPVRGQMQQEVEADDALSSIQGGGKAGWCYIGMEKGYRSCASVESSDLCMSGEIFPTQDVCINPTLRV